DGAGGDGGDVPAAGARPLRRKVCGATRAPGAGRPAGRGTGGLRPRLRRRARKLRGGRGGRLSGGALVAWVAVPYACLAVFAVGHVWRFRSGQLTWTTRSSQIFEGRLLRVGSPLFHLGLLAVIG